MTEWVAFLVLHYNHLASIQSFQILNVDWVLSYPSPKMETKLLDTEKC